MGCGRGVSRREEPLSQGFLIWMELRWVILREVWLYWSFCIKSYLDWEGPGVRWLGLEIRPLETDLSLGNKGFPPPHLLSSAGLEHSTGSASRGGRGAGTFSQVFFPPVLPCI